MNPILKKLKAERKDLVHEVKRLDRAIAVYMGKKKKYKARSKKELKKENG